MTKRQMMISLVERRVLAMDIRTNQSKNIDFESNRKVEQERVKKASRYASKISSKRTDGDHLTLSEKAIEFRELKGMLDNIPEVRQERVMELREKIKQGEYNINSDEVAEEILMEEIALSRVW